MPEKFRLRLETQLPRVLIQRPGANHTGICPESVTRLQQSPLDNATNVLQVHLP
jgi:hypothetical protein